MSKHDHHNSNTNRSTTNRNHGFGPNHPRFAPGHRPNQSRVAAKLKVVSKADDFAVAESNVYKSKWIEGKNGGLIAAMRVNGRIVFADRKGPKPKNDGKDWSFHIVGENPKQTVFFARILIADIPAGDPTLTIIKLPSGKFVCPGRRPIVLPFVSAKPKKNHLAQYRSATPNDKFEHDDDWYRDSDLDYLFDRSPDGENGEGDDEEMSAFEQASESPIWAFRRNRPVNCHACGFEDCRCDGSASDWLPARTTLNVLA